MSLTTSTTASVPMPRVLRPDLVLVALPPRERVEQSSGLITLPAESIMVDRLGVVLQVGAAVREVAPGARVLFNSEAGEELLVNEWPCLLLREQDLDAVLSRED